MQTAQVWTFERPRIREARSYASGLRTFLVFVAIAYKIAALAVNAVQLCSLEAGGGVCPNENTCCPTIATDDGTITSGCIPNDMGRNATCCSDGYTGCPLDYECVQSDRGKRCHSLYPQEDPLVSILPRYQLCSAPQVSQVHGFSINPSLIETRAFAQQEELDLKLIYYSSHGDITHLKQHHGLERAIIGIHGANRNADDYFCSLVGAARLAGDAKILIVAPRFPVATDSDLSNITSGGSALVWPDTDPSGTWRYGADAANLGNVSAFRALDDLVRYIQERITRRVTIVGHSSGGQLVQRWALMSAVEDANLRYIVANPSSYAYLSEMRWLDGKFRIPEQSLFNCSDYNRWRWGLDPPYHVPYIKEVMNHESLATLRNRFSKRHVVYLIGGQDKCSGLPWCNAHGLETSCRDQLQGPNRWERHFRYLRHLLELGISPRNLTVPGVGHDHSLMFSSQAGLSVLFPRTLEAHPIEAQQ